jgi:pyrrolidone-carboxylate peptidase
MNESWEIASRLPPHVQELYSYPKIRLIVSPEPIKVSYHAIYDSVPKLLQEHKPDIVLHMGLDEGRTFYGIERSASRDGYHQNLDIDRKVFTKAETKKVWGGFPATLTTTLDLDDVLVRWQSGVKKKDVDVRVSDDVGDFVCGFIYYASLAAMGDGRRDVVFLRKYKSWEAPLLHEYLCTNLYLEPLDLTGDN